VERFLGIVTEGEIAFRSGPNEVVLGAGGYIVKPRNELHTMWNAGKVPARMIEVISPAGFEGFFWELADLLEAGPPDFAKAGAIADRYGLVLTKPTGFPTSSPATSSPRLRGRLPEDGPRPQNPRWRARGDCKRGAWNPGVGKPSSTWSSHTGPGRRCLACRRERAQLRPIVPS
jgi:hypothetical protein